MTRGEQALQRAHLLRAGNGRCQSCSGAFEPASLFVHLTPAVVPGEHRKPMLLCTNCHRRFHTDEASGHASDSILFSAPMVRALLAGTKTQTRRVVKDTGLYAIDAAIHGPETAARELQALASRCPYGQPGHKFWVREAWARTTVGLGTEMVVYREGDNRTDYGGPWKPGIHMFRRDSRITLEVTGVRVERLQDISEADAIAEGLERTARGHWLPGPCDHPEWAYHQLWDQINGAGAWDANPWVWAVSFRAVKP